MTALIDTNILLDFIQHREHFSSSERILTLCAERKLNGFMAAHSVPNIFYILRKGFSDDERRSILLSLIELVPVVNVDQMKIESALRQKSFADFEDCLQSKCAEKIGADYIITRNISDYSDSNVQPIFPDDFLKEVIG